MGLVMKCPTCGAIAADQCTADTPMECDVLWLTPEEMKKFKEMMERPVRARKEYDD